MTPLPAGSTITVGTDACNTVIAVPYRQSGIARYGACLFLLCWLGGWGYGWIHVGSDLMAGRGSFFTLVWFGAWTVGGFFAAYMLYRMLRPSVPELFRLMPQGLRYDSGIPSFDMSSFNTNNQQYRQQSWSAYFPKRVHSDLDRKALQSLRLRQTTFSNRLTIDAGATRIDLARDATEIEREWLYQVLAERYSLVPSTQAKSTGIDALEA